MDFLAIKQSLYSQCIDFVENKILIAQQAVNMAQESANSETKSSAGDKHETSRAMAMLEQSKNAQALGELIKMKPVLQALEPTTKIVQSSIELGSLIITSNKNFYISIAAGKLTYGGLSFFAISPASPIGKALLPLKKGDSLVFRGQTAVLKTVS